MQSNLLQRSILRRKVVCAKTGLSASSIDRAEHRGEFPQRVILSIGAVGWYSDEIDRWINNRQRGFASAPVEANAARRKAVA